MDTDKVRVGVFTITFAVDISWNAVTLHRVTSNHIVELKKLVPISVLFLSNDIVLVTVFTEFY